jgi:hypothetical protein
VPQGGEAPSAESVERLDKRMASCKKKLTTTARQVEVKLKPAQGVLKQELSAMRSKCSAAKRKLDRVIAMAKEQGFPSGIIRETWGSLAWTLGKGDAGT